MTKRIYMMRHGQTLFNVLNKILGVSKKFFNWC